MKGKRILSAVLSAALLLQLSPLAVFAEDTSLLPAAAQTVQTEPAPEEPTPEPTQEPAGEETALPEEPAPEETAVPMAAPTTEPAAEPTAAPAPEETPAPDAAATPAPEPSAEPTAAPDPAAEVQAMIDALPDEVTEDNAEAVEQALTDIDDAKESLTDDELAGLDLTRYDAAANALLALLGEAATDAVEMLDNYATPTKDGDWYVIDSVDDLYWLASASKYVKAKLTADITINSSVLDSDGNLISNPKLTSWKPIGTSYNSSFKGTFDGGGHTISGLYFNDSKKNYVGLFGYVGEGGTVKNVTITDSYVSGSRCVGGICGNNNGIVQDCTSGCTVKGTDDFTGGICGFNNFGSLKNCHNTGKVSGNTDVGGVCGYNEYGILQESYNTGEVSGNTYVGGVCGQNHGGTVKRCYNTGEVSGESNVGGVCGCNISGAVQESYNTGEVFGNNNFVGGVCGQNQGNVKGCYNTGAVTGKSQVGGVCGGTSSTGCYYLDTSGTDSKGGISKTLAEFQSGEVAFLLQKALDDAATESAPAPQVWGQKLNTDDYPKLSSDDRVYQTTTCTGGYSNSENQPLDHNYVDGICSRCGDLQQAKDVGNNCYEISNQGQLYWFANQVNTVNSSINAKLTADITINSGVLNEKGELHTGANFTPWTLIGTNTNPFTGTFDGNNKTISGLYINVTADYVGLFGCVGNGGTVKNVTLADSYVSGNRYVGGICGQNKCGTLQNCHNNGKVSGAWYVGGVCGSNTRPLSSDPPSTIQECYNTGKVSGKDYVGGVCGQNNRATVEKSYNTNTVSGGSYVGGVCGENNYSGTVNGCYTTGEVSGTGFKVGGVCGYNYDGTVKGTVENCYYLAGTSANAVGDGNEGTNCESKTELQFRNGAVAYQLQSDLNITTQVWGQRIDPNDTGETDKTPVLNSTSAYTVYPAAEGSTCKRYSNTPDQTFTQHEYNNEYDVCIRCGAWQEATPNGDYYEIHNQGQLRWFADQVSNKGQTTINARLMASFAMGSTEWTPIGTESNPFAGKFDGNGNTITGLTCTNTKAEYVGLVGYASSATIQNVTVQDSAFKGNWYIGAVCGYITGGTITNCHAVNTAIGGTGGYTEGKYYGGIVGYITGTTNVTGCTNSDSTVNGGYCLGGIAGFAGRNTTVQRCFNSGAVTCKYAKSGGIVGQTLYATVQDCGNTGAVTKPYYNSQQYGGIVGEDFDSSTIQNCYNTDSNTVAKICGDGWCRPSNCYYLPGDTGSSGSTGTGITAKTAEQFASGEVAYLLQNGRPDTVWGQTLTGEHQQAYPVPGGEKVYQSAPCKSEYTNTESKTVEHVFGSDGICEKCGQPQIAYTVTIPASVELGNTATITATGVTLPDGKELNVKVATESGRFEVALDGDTREYTVTNVTDGGTEVKPGGNPVLTVVNGVAESSVELQFNKPETTTYSGEYKGTVKFTVSVE